MAGTDDDSERQRQWLSTNIRARREELGASQDEVARAMSERGHRWHQSTVAKVERGARAVEAVEASALAQVLRTQIDVLISPPMEQQLAADVRDLGQAVHRGYGMVVNAARAMLDAQHGLRGAVESHDQSSGVPVLAQAVLEERGRLDLRPEDAVREARRLHESPQP